MIWLAIVGLLWGLILLLCSVSGATRPRASWEEGRWPRSWDDVVNSYRGLLRLAAVTIIAIAIARIITWT